MLALALAPQPELLVLDDPTLGLDAFARRFAFEELVGDLADRRTTVLVTSHDLAGIEGIADRVGFLAGGRLALTGALEQLKAEQQASLEEIFLDVCAGAHPMRTVWSVAYLELREWRALPVLALRPACWPCWSSQSRRRGRAFERWRRRFPSLRHWRLAIVAGGSVFTRDVRDGRAAFLLRVPRPPGPPCGSASWEPR